LVIWLTKPSMFGKQNNQLPSKSHVELKDNSIRVTFKISGPSAHHFC
jgi:hypothetical protein